MFTEQIERLKQAYTDKFVLVDGTQPELARFRDVVGRVKTVNMSGRALVEFDDYHLNVGWYDIDLEFLKVVDQPPPKPPKPVAKKPAAKAEAKPAAAKPQATKTVPAAGAKAGKPSIADILAAARGGKAGGAAPAKAKAETPAASPPAPKAQPAAKVDRSKMSVAEMIAAARAGGAGTEATAKAAAKPPAEQPAADVAPKEEIVAEAPPASDVASADGKTVTRVDKSSMSIDDILGYCRQHDAK
jgi:hypothetical protein